MYFDLRRLKCTFWMYIWKTLKAVQHTHETESWQETSWLKIKLNIGYQIQSIYWISRQLNRVDHDLNKLEITLHDDACLFWSKWFSRRIFKCLHIFNNSKFDLPLHNCKNLEKRWKCENFTTVTTRDNEKILIRNLVRFICRIF